MLALLLAVVLPADAVVLDNPYVRVVRDAAPCAMASAPECADRVIVALGDIDLLAGGERKKLIRGEVAVFGADQSYEAPSGGPYYEVSIKPDHPPAQAPREIIPAEKNALRYDGARFFVFEERLAPGDTRARHSHSQRVVIQLNRTRLRQWPDGADAIVVETVPDRVSFSPAVIHKVENIGDVPLRGVIIELKPQK